MAPRKILTVLLLLAMNSTFASGGSESPEDYFVLRSRPDVNLNNYQAGQLGIILPNYPRVFLYPAWRAIMLGEDGLRKDRIEAGVLEQLCCAPYSGWTDDNAADAPRKQWQNLRASISNQLPKVKLSAPYDESDPYRFYNDCTDESYKFATATLTHLKQRPDATPALLQQWVSAQDQVYEMCGYPDHMSAPELPAFPALPQALDENTPKVWRQYREYQIAAAAFYAGQHQQAFELFSAMAKQDDHPMQQWGAYLALRSKIRAMSIIKQPQLILKTGDGVLIFPEDIDDADMREIEQLTNDIVKNPKMIVVHELARASLRAFKYRATSHKQFAALSSQLNNYRNNPYRDDVLSDWRRLANNFFDNNDKHPLLATTRQQYDFFDWISSIQGLEAKHAWDKWQQAKDDAQKRAWLVAVLITTQQLTPELEQQARKVSSQAPEYLTVQYNLARLLRLSQQAESARKLLDALLSQTNITASARNLLLQERFAVASSLSDASKYLMRQAAGSIVPDNQQLAAAQQIQPKLDSDGLYWINQRLSVNDLLSLSDMTHLPMSLRNKLTQMAWARAHLLGKQTLAQNASDKVAAFLPDLEPLVNRYQQAGNELQRKQALFLAALDYGVSVTLDANEARQYDNLCCSLGEDTLPENLPASPQVSEDAAQRDQEISALQKLKLGGAYFSKHLLEYVKAYPQDSDNPRLLARVVHANKHWQTCESDREECANLAQKCFNLLHKQYGKSKWAQETKYWYK